MRTKWNLADNIEMPSPASANNTARIVLYNAGADLYVAVDRRLHYIVAVPKGDRYEKRRIRHVAICG